MLGKWREFPQANAFSKGFSRMASVGGGLDRILLTVGTMGVGHTLQSCQGDILNTLSLRLSSQLTDIREAGMRKESYSLCVQGSVLPPRS